MKMTIMKRYIKILGLFAAMAAAASCQDLILEENMDMPGREGYVTVTVQAQIPDMNEIHTKAVDPDGVDIQTLDLYCFNGRGLFISIERVSLNSTGSLTGTYKADIPEVTERIHFIANMHKEVNEMDFVGHSEDQVIATMEGSSGMMTYWARVVKDEGKTMKETLAAQTSVKLLRDHARITVIDEQNLYESLGFIVLNTNAFGTVAPYRDGSWEAPSNDNKFVTLPDSERKNIKVSNQNDVIAKSSREYQYVFETENPSSDPINVVIRGTRNGQTKYFKVMLIDEESEYVPVMRNHTYKIFIKGELDYGQESFEAALTAPASNNVWLSVADDVKEVRSSDYALAVKETHIVLGVDDEVFDTPHRQYTVEYTYTDLNGNTLTAADEPEVYWYEGNTVAQQSFVSKSFDIDGNKASGKVVITLNTLLDGEVVREGTLLIKKGMLERKVKIYTVATQSFVPAWITTNIYGGEAGSKVALMFTVPEECPEALFPMDVLVSVNDLDVRNESGMKLPVITKEDERYGSDVDGISYKYVLTVTEPGMQRLYLQTNLSHSTGETVSVTIEADHFTPLSKTATFRDETDARILIHNLRSYVAETPADEYIYYYLVPQKINAQVEFSTHLGHVVQTAPASGEGVSLTDPAGNVTHFEFIEPNTDFSGNNVDEFLLYSQNLEHNLDKSTYYFDFYKDLNPTNWSGTAGRVLGFYRNSTTGDPILHLKTNKPKADEVVRIASNVYGALSITTGTKGDKATMDYSSAVCTGTGTYRSCVFELATFHPFHFGAQVEVDGLKVGEAIYGQSDIPIDNVLLTYEPGQEVTVEFDITSFKSSMMNEDAENQLSVDPFGTAFEIYIDAPTLKLDVEKVAQWGLSSKIIADPNVAGRVIYKVDADREIERWSSPAPVLDALAQDDAQYDLFRNPIGGVNQSGERKVIPFKTDQIVSSGEITLSSDEDMVVYYKKTFRIQNRSIEGTITYGSGRTAVPMGSFVPFSTDDGTRIGVVSVDADGLYSLNLRAEYNFDWKNTPVNFEFEINDVEYRTRIDSLEKLFETTDVNLQ